MEIGDTPRFPSELRATAAGAAQLRDRVEADQGDQGREAQGVGRRGLPRQAGDLDGPGAVRVPGAAGEDRRDRGGAGSGGGGSAPRRRRGGGPNGDGAQPRPAPHGDGSGHGARRRQGGDAGGAGRASPRPLPPGHPGGPFLLTPPYRALNYPTQARCSTKCQGAVHHPSKRTMATRVKGLFRGFKHISKIFSAKEDEMEIGHPTDVKHVAHIGGNCDSVHSPSWMKRFNSTADFSSLGNVGQARRSLSGSQGSYRARGIETSFQDSNSSETGTPRAPKQMKRRKHRPESSSSRPSKKASRVRAPYVASLGDDNEAPDQLRGI
ncbi:rRNA 2'-O-methyltransferase fibrillarin-like isoform X2 [Zingiber officinale]|uniref:rRNA 2'-O-methyltransferase fibrillarin-like isoform X2 n=1 Tax=Zingiber officinale TaxID=94328 RepID=UPI001C4C1B13|nr:rRNA 2'-O-methyltransferase fibrillarin-like isoform X2 [Zingiber officinale]